MLTTKQNLKPNYRNHLGLFLVKLFSAVCFAVLYSTLAIYLLSFQHFKASAVDITGSFMALFYLLPTIMGLVGSHYIRFDKLLPLALCFVIVGCYLLSFNSHPDLIMLGLSLFLVGGSTISVSINILISEIEKGNPANRRQAYIFNYMAMNIGIFLGYTMAGKFELANEYHLLFYTTSFIALFSLFLYFIIARRSVTSNQKAAEKSVEQLIKAGFSLFAIISATFLIVRSGALSDDILLFIMCAALAVIYFYVKIRLKPTNLANHKMFIIFFSLSILFWSIYFLTPTLLMLLIKIKGAGTLFDIRFPPQWYNNIDPIVIVIGAPLLSLILLKIKNRFKSLTQSIVLFVIAILFSNMALWVLSLGVSLSKEHIYPLWIIGFIGLASIGDLFLGPTGYSVVSDLYNSKYKPLMMGTWPMSLGLGSIVASKLAKFILYSGGEKVHVNIVSAVHGLLSLSFVTLLIVILFLTYLFVRRNSLFKQLTLY